MLCPTHRIPDRLPCRSPSSFRGSRRASAAERHEINDAAPASPQQRARTNAACSGRMLGQNIAIPDVPTVGAVQRLFERRRSIHNPVPTPPTRPPNQLRPPRLKSKSVTGASDENSSVQSSLAPMRPPITPATAASTPSLGRPLRLSSRPNIQMPMRAPTATSTPKLVISKSPMRNRTGYMLSTPNAKTAIRQATLIGQRRSRAACSCRTRTRSRPPCQG
jgi:hypothetical protein